MKRIYILILCAITVIKIQAQDYLISFAAAGDTTEVSNVKVDNLTSGASAMINGGDILHLSATVGIDEQKNAKGNMQIYPNPMAVQSTLTFSVPVHGDAVIDIVDLSGQTIYRVTRLLSPGNQSFRITGLDKGMYFVKVSGIGYTYSTKLISENSLRRNISIEYVSFEPDTRSSRLKNSSSTIDMLYKTGDRILFKGISGRFSTLITDIPFSSKTITFSFAACTDKDKNDYTTVQIGTQTWMAENLKTTKFRDGNSIPLVTDNTAWGNLITPGYCWYNNDEITYKNMYGALYNWYTVGTGTLAPAGWHVATQAEWTTLINYLGGEFSTAADKLKETGTNHWNSAGATNESGFTALPGGIRFNSGDFSNVGIMSEWWSSTPVAGYGAWSPYLLDFPGGGIGTSSGSEVPGYSVRCIKD